jgi:uncharacterized protein YjbJ (UPF0337 family)
MKHKGQEMGGKAKQQVGEHTDDRSLEAEGQADETKADLKQAADKAKDAFS